jgi:hypothetical protein
MTEKRHSIGIQEIKKMMPRIGFFARDALGSRVYLYMQSAALSALDLPGFLLPSFAPL